MTPTHAELNELEQTANTLFVDLCTPASAAAAETDGWHPRLWAAIDQAGFTDVSVPEERGGAGGTPAEALAILRAAGRSAAAVPLAETGLMAGQLLTAAGLDLPLGVRIVVPPAGADELVLEGDQLSGTARGLAWGRHASWIVVLLPRDGENLVAVLPGPALEMTTGVSVVADVNLAGEPRDDLTFDHVPVARKSLAPVGTDPGALQLLGAAGRAAMMAGALSSMADLTLRYTRQRKQFGKPVSSFQSVQQHLVTLHQQAALVSAAVDGMLTAISNGPAPFEIAAAKLLANQAAVAATRAAHQAHGAIGMTQEYQLHQFSRRLWSWRAEYGNDRYWSSRLGSGVASAGPDALYPTITAGSAAMTP
ncbi:MAG: putative Acyl-CoA dehydrogenase [Marmoricola sp.]|nr:putative Acyl-CoA dehydrogenase [Marmoricola sp.]